MQATYQTVFKVRCDCPGSARAVMGIRNDIAAVSGRFHIEIIHKGDDFPCNISFIATPRNDHQDILMKAKMRERFGRNLLRVRRVTV